jgi:hypothetical protein
MANKIRYPNLVEKAARLYLELGSTHKVAAELGIDKTTAWSYIKLSGIDMSSKNVSKMASKNKSIVVDGITFYWSKKGYYRGVTAPGRREMLSSYMYRKIHGTEKPKWLTIVFKDGNRDNYAPENLDFVSASEWARLLSKDEDRHALLCQSLDEGRKVYKDMCEKKPYIKVITARRAWNTRRRNDPDDTWTEKCQATRRANAEKRGYWFTPEGIENMRKSHVGNTKEVVRAKRMEREQAAIRNKLGMR